MKAFLNEIRAALNAGLYRIALISALTLPDVCAQLYPDTTNNSQPADVNTRYQQWYNNYAKDKCLIDARTCYLYRCSMVHNIKSTLRSNDKIAFFVPGTTTCAFMDCDVDITYKDTNGNDLIEKARMIDINLFIEGMITATEEWLKVVENEPLFNYNYQFFLQERPDSPLQMLSGGLPVY